MSKSPTAPARGTSFAFDSTRLYPTVPAPRQPNSSSTWGLLDFNSIDEFVDELFRHAVEVCRILCPNYWTANRNLFSVSAKTPEDLAQTIMAKTWVPRYAKLIREDPSDFTIDGFRKRFFVAAQRVCRIENRYQRAGLRHMEENWMIDLDDAVQRGMEPQYTSSSVNFNEVTLSPNGQRVLLLKQVLNSMQDVRRSLLPHLGKEAVDIAISEVTRTFNLKESTTPMSLEWKQLMLSIKELPPMNASQREELIEELVETPVSERKSLRSRLVQGYFSTAIEVASKEGVGRWKADRLVTRLTKALNLAIIDWCKERDAWEPEERLNEIRIRAFEEYKAIGQVVDPEELKDIWRKIRMSAIGEAPLSDSELTRLQALHDNMQAAVKNQEGFIVARVNKETKNDPTNRRLIVDMAIAVRKTLHAPGIDDQYEVIDQADVAAAQDDILRGRVAGTVVSKSYGALAAEFMDTLPVDSQAAIYSDLINGGLNVRPLSPEEGAIRLKALVNNSRSMLGADYRILAEFLDIHINSASSPVVILRLAHEKIATTPGIEIPEYVKQVLEALQDAVFNPTSVNAGMDTVLRSVREEPVSDLATDDKCLSELCAINVQRRSDNEIEIFPVRLGATALYAALNAKALWHQWLRERGIEARLEAPPSGGGGKILISGAFVKTLSMGEAAEIFMGVVRFLRS